MTEIIAFGSDCPITVVDREESGPGASVSTEKDASVSKRKLIDWPPTVTDTQGSSHVIRTGECVGTPGNLQSQIDCPESPTPGAYTSGGSLSSSVVLYRLDRELGAAQTLESNLAWDAPPLHSNSKPNPFHLGSSGHFSSMGLESFVYFFFAPCILYHNIPSEPAVTDF